MAKSRAVEPLWARVVPVNREESGQSGHHHPTTDAGPGVRRYEAGTTAREAVLGFLRVVAVHRPGATVLPLGLHLGATTPGYHP